MSEHRDATRRKVRMFIAASGGVILLVAIAIFATGGNPILGGVMLLAALSDLGVAIYLGARG